MAFGIWAETFRGLRSRQSGEENAKLWGGGGGINFLVNRGNGVRDQRSGIREQGAEKPRFADIYYCALVDGYLLQPPAVG
jgi:hypothetical protein